MARVQGCGYVGIDLRKVAKLEHNPDSSLFELNMDFGKVYKLRARDASEAKHWATTLRRRIKHKPTSGQARACAPSALLRRATS